MLHIKAKVGVRVNVFLECNEDCLLRIADQCTTISHKIKINTKNTYFCTFPEIHTIKVTLNFSLSKNKKKTEIILK